MLNNFVSQAATMGTSVNPDNTNTADLLFLLELHGIPNDLLENIDPLAIIVFIPIISKTIYPYLQHRGIPFRPIARITVGFIFAALAMFCAAGVQYLIYSSVILIHIPQSFLITDISLIATLLRLSQLWSIQQWFYPQQS
jgi:POT family proton-dependent oligopeptide transporter